MLARVRRIRSRRPAQPGPSLRSWPCTSTLAPADGSIRRSWRAISCSSVRRRATANAFWPSPHSRARLGFAHGNSGIAYALLQLASVTRHKRFEEAALSALEYERPFYSPVQRSWPALVDDDRARDAAGLTVWMNAWCYGAAGMALARARAWHLTGDPLLRAEAMHALEATEATPPSMAEHLCCGNLGRAEVMLTAAQWLGDAQLARRSRQLAAGGSAPMPAPRARGAVLERLYLCGLAAGVLSGPVGSWVSLLAPGFPRRVAVRPGIRTVALSPDGDTFSNASCAHRRLNGLIAGRRPGSRG